jgi:trimethylamine---corrinoid protein Co-methyltransferase
MRRRARTGRPSRRERAAKRESRSELPLLRFKFRQLRNPLKPLEIASPEQLELLHLAAMDILENVGLEFLDDEALDIWHKAGAKVDHRARRVRIDRGLVIEAIASAPSTFTWRARNPAHNLTIGGNSIVFGAHSGMAYVSNFDVGRRPGTLEDLQNLVKLAQTCNVLHLPNGALVEPQDLPVSSRHLHRTYAALTLTDKAVRAAGHGRLIPIDDMNMARIVFGDDISSQPVLGTAINVNSPLRYDERMLGGLITYARHGQVAIVTPFILAGAMSPITVAAALAQQNAEALAGIALTQLVNPGVPVLYGGFTTNIDMKSGSPAFGTPEGAWAMVIGAQLARRYNLPYRGSGSLTTSQAPDAQAAYETQWTLWPAVLAHTNLIHHAVGWLDGGLTVSYEKFIIDVEGLAMFYHFLEGFSIDDDSLALDMIAEVGPGGHHFGTSHTQARFSTEFYQPFLSDRLGFEPWQAGGGWDAAQRAHHIWKTVLDQYEPPPLEPAMAEALADYVARREQELEGVDLYR